MARHRAAIQRPNPQMPGVSAVDPRENRRACSQPISFNDAGYYGVSAACPASVRPPQR
jgi:hypothetical protein